MIHTTGLSTLKINTKSKQDQPKMETCGYLSSLIRQKKRPLQSRVVHVWNGLSVNTKDYSLEKFEKYVAVICSNVD